MRIDASTPSPDEPVSIPSSLTCVVACSGRRVPRTNRQAIPLSGASYTHRVLRIRHRRRKR